MRSKPRRRVPGVTAPAGPALGNARGFITARQLALITRRLPRGGRSARRPPRWRGRRRHRSGRSGPGCAASPPCCDRVSGGRSLTSTRIVSASRRTRIEAKVSTIAAHRAEPQRVRRSVAGFAAVLLARAVHLAGARLRQGRAAGARPRRGRRVPRAGIWDPHLARCCPGSATAGPYWLAEPVPAALALIASARCPRPRWPCSWLTRSPWKPA